MFTWAFYEAAAHPELKNLFAVPNGGLRSKTEAARLKAAGVKAGVPDIMLAVARCGFHGLFIEMKVGKNKTSAAQDEWIRLSIPGHLSPDTGYFRLFSLFSSWRASARLRLKKKKFLENFSVAGACSFHGADFCHNDKEAAVNT